MSEAFTTIMETATVKPLQSTPLRSFHQRHGARLVDFAGWELPMQYTGILEEHKATREAAGLFDVSHMGELRIHGPQATALLEYLLTNEFTHLKNGRARYTLMCEPSGGVVDDLIVYRRSEDDYWLCVNACNTEKDAAWIQKHGERFDAQIENISSEYALLAIQGPRAVDIVKKLAWEGVDQLPRFAFESGSLEKAKVILSRTGYTGEDGFEIYCAPDQAEVVAEALLRVGEPQGLHLAGLGARDSLRLEAGLPLYGHEISATITPLQAGLERFVKLDKPADFIGKEALKMEASAGPKQRIVYFKLDGRRIARQNDEVFQKDQAVGTVVSGTLSPILNQPIGAALIEEAFLKDTELNVAVRGHRVPLKQVKPPFHKPAKDTTQTPRLLFTATHEWVRIEDDGVVVIGITDFAQESLGDVTFVELPDVGTEVMQGKAFGVVESVKAASELYAPVSGKVLAVNERLQEMPGTLNESPLEEGWLLRIRPDAALTPEVIAASDGLLDTAGYRALVNN